MKYLLPVVALTILFTACEKKKPSRFCYSCYRADSLVSNIPKLEKPAYFTLRTELCDVTDEQKDVYEKIRRIKDTTYYSNDTVVMKVSGTECIYDYQPQ